MVRPGTPGGWTTSGQPPFVARHEEVAALESAWADALSGAGRAVFVSGEPGSGKSRLVSEVCIRLRANGAAVLVGSCIQELGAPFEPFDEPLRVLFPASDRVQWIRPTWNRASSSPHVLDRAGQDAADRTIGQERVFSAVIDVIRAAARRAPWCWLSMTCTGRGRRRCNC